MTKKDIKIDKKNEISLKIILKDYGIFKANLDELNGELIDNIF